jgi:hypothetical protein
VWLDLVGISPDRTKGGVVYIPAHSATEVPGRGLQDLADAYSTGGLPLLLVSAENLLGVRIDRYVVMDPSGAQSFFNQLGPVSIDVPDEVKIPAGHHTARVLFQPGLQRLPAEFLTKLLYTEGLGGDDQDLGTRNVAFWDGLFDGFDPDRLRSAFGATSLDSNAPISVTASLLAEVASLQETSRRVDQLPVEQVSVGGSELYRSDPGRLASFLTSAIGPVTSPSSEVSVQVLNGNGVPGVGEKVAQRLIGKGFRVILSGNAPTFPNQKRTLIVTYPETHDARALAERVRSLLGVGRIQASQQGQGIVDLTIVVGKDFPSSS